MADGTNFERRDTGGNPRTPDAVARALRLRREIEAFEQRWPEPLTPGAAAPVFTWDQLARQLEDLADTPIKAAMARDLVSGTAKLARFKPPEMVLREILCLAWTLLDEGFRPEEATAETP